MTVNRDITRLLQQGDAQSLEQLFPIVYGELREIAAALFRGEYRANHTLQPTALVHEAYLRLLPQRHVSWQDRSHFYAIAARSMRRVLLDHARDLAEEQGVGLLRVDCYGGDDRALVRYYEREGFRATEPFTVDTPRGPWPGQVLEKRVDGPRWSG